jgi:hypothetical protein
LLIFVCTNGSNKARYLMDPSGQFIDHGGNLWHPIANPDIPVLISLIDAAIE